MRTRLLSSVLLLSGFAVHAELLPVDIVSRMRSEVHAQSIQLEGESALGGRCWAVIRLSDETQRPYLGISLKDAHENATYFVVPGIQPISDGTSYINSQSVYLIEGNQLNPRRAGFNRFAKLDEWRVTGPNNLRYPSEITLGKQQIEPHVEEYSFRCYSLAPSALRN